MQTHTSEVKVGGQVSFPEWKGDRHYMVPFTVANGLPFSVGRWQQTVNQMMDGIEVDRNQECYLMVDEKEVTPGSFHRRPGLHVDGYWDPGAKGHGGHRAQCHGSGPVGHWGTPNKHRNSPKLPSHTGGSGEHIPSYSGHSGGHCATGVSEGLLLASNYSAARAMVGQYRRDFVSDWRGGDCSELSAYGLKEEILQANRVYRLNVMTLHESLPIHESVRRTVVRINVPNWKN